MLRPPTLAKTWMHVLDCMCHSDLTAFCLACHAGPGQQSTISPSNSLKKVAIGTARAVFAYPPAERSNIRESWGNLMRWSKVFRTRQDLVSFPNEIVQQSYMCHPISEMGPCVKLVCITLRPVALLSRWRTLLKPPRRLLSLVEVHLGQPWAAPWLSKSQTWRWCCCSETHFCARTSTCCIATHAISRHVLHTNAWIAEQEFASRLKQQHRGRQ